MNITIIGQGAIGLLYYCYLINNTDVNLSLYPSSRIKNSPEKVAFLNHSAQFKLIDLHIASSTQLSNADVILLCVKSYQVKAVINEIAAHINKDTIVILSHNGMGVIEQLPTVIQNNTLLLLLTTHGSIRLEDFSIEHTGIGRTDLGMITGNIEKRRKEQLITYFTAVNNTAYWQESIAEHQWTKLAINCVINPITALDNIDNGLVTKADYQDTVTKLLTEIVNLAQLHNISLNYENLYATVIKVAEDTAKNCSSMRSDILAKRETEIDYINGYIHRLGKKYNLATPINTKMWRRVKQISHD